MDCARCTERDDEGRLLPVCVANRERWACDAPLSDDAPPLLTAEEMGTALPLRRCPRAEAVPRMQAALPFLGLAHNHGLLPVAGGTLDQSADFNDALLVYGRTMSMVEAEKLAEAKQKQSMQT